MDVRHEDRARIQSVTLDDLNRVTRMYLVPEREAVGIVQPRLMGMLRSLIGWETAAAKEDTAPVMASADEHRRPGS